MRSTWLGWSLFRSKGIWVLNASVSLGEVRDFPTFFTFRKDFPDAGHLQHQMGGAIRVPSDGGCMEPPRDLLFQEWIDSWANETGLGVPCGEAQADGVPCFELDRDCAECEEAYQAWLEYRRKKGLGPGS